MAMFWTPDGVCKEFYDFVPPAPWQATDPKETPKADPDQQEKSELVAAIENLGGKADRRHSVDNLRAQFQALVDAHAETPDEDPLE